MLWITPVARGTPFAQTPTFTPSRRPACSDAVAELPSSAVTNRADRGTDNARMSDLRPGGGGFSGPIMTAKHEMDHSPPNSPCSPSALAQQGALLSPPGLGGLRLKPALVLHLRRIGAPRGPSLDQESPGSSPGGATQSGSTGSVGPLCFSPGLFRMRKAPPLPSSSGSAGAIGRAIRPGSAMAWTEWNL